MKAYPSSPQPVSEHEALFCAIETLILQSTSQMSELLDFLRFIPLERRNNILKNLQYLERDISQSIEIHQEKI